jgi:hypothetical protein
MRIFDRAGREIETAGLVNEYGQPVSALGGTLGRVTLGDPDLGEYAAKYLNYTKVLAKYVINIILGWKVPAAESGSVTLRPEDFLWKGGRTVNNGEIQNPWRNNQAGELEANANGWYPYIGKSIQNRCVEMEFSDEFTKFMADKKAFIAAIFGDSDGFLDLPKPIILQGKQTLTIRLNRINWPFPIGPINDETWPDPFDVRFDFVFDGIMLLPPGTHESGSAPIVSE